MAKVEVVFLNQTEEQPVAMNEQASISSAGTPQVSLGYRRLSGNATKNEAMLVEVD